MAKFFTNKITKTTPKSPHTTQNTTTFPPNTPKHRYKIIPG